MITKNSSLSKKIEKPITESSESKVVAEVKKVSLVGGREFASTRVKSGNPFFIGSTETRLHPPEENRGKVNGSSVIFLAILGVNEEIRKGKIKIVDAVTARAALAATRKAEFKTDSWIRVERTYSTLGRSKNMRSKIGVVFNPIVRALETGFLRAIDMSAIASEAYRKSVGFTY